MAKLHSDNLCFEFRYVDVVDEWIQYQFSFLWKGEPLVRDGALKRGNEYWNSRPAGVFLANEDQADTFLPFLKKVLDTDRADYWEPVEPDIMVALYPDDYFPFLPSHLSLVRESDERRREREARETLKASLEKLPDDRFTFIASVDAYNFREADAYYGQGLAMHMIVERRELEAFANALEREYAAFRKRFGIKTCHTTGNNDG